MCDSQTLGKNALAIPMTGILPWLLSGMKKSKQGGAPQGTPPMVPGNQNMSGGPVSDAMQANSNWSP